MTRVRVASFVAVCVASLWMTANALAQPNPEAERYAKIYMRAFFSGDVKTAADLTDPRTLERIRETFLADLIKVDPDSEQAVLANLGVAKTMADLVRIDAKSMYVAITEAEHRNNPQALEIMKQSRVEVLGSAPNPSGGVIVLFRITAPGAGGASSKESGLVMRQVLGEWKVVGNARP
jgi:hypothetical protein